VREKLCVCARVCERESEREIKRESERAEKERESKSVNACERVSVRSECG